MGKSATRPSMHRDSFVLKLLAILIGLGLLVGLEVVLQLLDAGPSNQLFIVAAENDEERTYAINREVAHRFFQPQYLRHVPFDAGFVQPKPPGTVRIFTLGASTLIGFPNPVNTSFPQFLARMLPDAYPGVRFEVLNCGITAINTFCIQDFVEEIVAYDPDLLIVYAGHNEFIGPYGVTTPFLKFGNNRTLIRLHMRLQRSKIFYYLEALIHGARTWGESASPEDAFGMHLVGKEMSFLDEGYRTTGRNFRENLTETLLTARRGGVPVLLSTLVSNLKDFYPLRSTCDTRQLKQRLDPLAAAGRLQEALQVCRQMLQISPYCASIHFEIGHLHYRRGEYDLARQAFVRARDMDLLPFRAPTVFNHIIRELATSGQEQVLLSDTEGAFATAAPHGIIGGELITEYLHPNVYGHYLIARNMVEDLIQSSVGRQWGQGRISRLEDFASYTHQLGYTLLDQINTRNDLMIFLRHMPYETPPAILRRQVAERFAAQLRDIPRLSPADRRILVDRGLLVFLDRMLDFLLPADRQQLARELETLAKELR